MKCKQAFSSTKLIKNKFGQEQTSSLNPFSHSRENWHVGPIQKFGPALIGDSSVKNINNFQIQGVKKFSRRRRNREGKKKEARVPKRLVND